MVKQEVDPTFTPAAPSNVMPQQPPVEPQSSEEALAAQSPTYAAMKALARKAYQDKQAEQAETKKKAKTFWPGVFAGAAGGPQVGLDIYRERHKNDNSNVEETNFLAAQRIDTDRALAEKGLDQQGKKIEADIGQGDRALDIRETEQEADAKFREASLELERLKVQQDKAIADGNLQLARDLQQERLRVESEMQRRGFSHAEGMQRSAFGHQEGMQEDEFRHREKLAEDEQAWRSGVENQSNRAGVLSSQGEMGVPLLEHLDGKPDFGKTKVPSGSALGYGGGQLNTIDDFIEQGVEIPQQVMDRDPDNAEAYREANKLIAETRRLGGYVDVGGEYKGLPGGPWSGLPETQTERPAYEEFIEGQGLGSRRK